jgi:hypothetical protein
MPQTNRADYKQYQREYYLKNLKKPNSRSYITKNTTRPPPPSNENNSDDDDDAEEIQQPKHKIKVDEEYTNYLHTKEYIPYPQHILPFIENNLRNIQPIRPMVQQHNQNLPNKYIFI